MGWGKIKGLKKMPVLASAVQKTVQAKSTFTEELNLSWPPFVQEVIV